MNGLLYKNLRQNLFAVIISALAPSTLLFIMIIFTSISEENTFSIQLIFQNLADSGIMIRLFFIFVGYMIVEPYLFLIISCDEIKKWAYFSISAPTGVKGQLYSKYLVIFMMCGITFICTYVADIILCSVTEIITGEEMTSVASVLIILFYIQIFMKAIDLPFAVRFGTHRGSNIKMVMLLGIFMIFIIYMLFGPLPVDSEKFFESIYEFIENFNSGNIPDWLFIVQGIFPVISVGGYILSYLISCKLYLKGIENYDK